MDEFNDEQQVVLAILRVLKVPEPEAIVRGDRVAATVIGGAVAPSVRALGKAMTAVTDAFMRAIDAAGVALADEAERIANEAAE